MNRQKAMNIGGEQGLKSGAIGLVLAEVITGLMFGDFLWAFKLSILTNIIIGAGILLVVSYLYGMAAGNLIIVKGWNAWWTGLLFGMLAFFSTGFLVGVPGFFMEGLDSHFGLRDRIVDYIFKPFFWISLFGFIPTIVISLWFGWSIKKKGLMHRPMQWYQLQ